MAGQSQRDEKPLLKAAFICAVSAVALMEAPSFYVAGYDAITLAAYGGLIFGAPPLVARALNIVADKFDDYAANIATGLKGSAAWATSLKDLKGHIVTPSLFRTGHAPYWGCMRRGIFGLFRSNVHIPITAVAACFGSSGSGKDVTVLLPNILATSGSKMIFDFDGSTTCIMAEELRGRGETVYILNFDDTFSEILGESDCYNPLHVVADNFEREGGILDVSSDCTQIANSLYPEPENDGAGANRFFRDGSRSLIKFAIQMMVLIKGHEATIGDVLALIQDRESLLQHALWAAGRLEQNPDGAGAAHG